VTTCYSIHHPVIYPAFLHIAIADTTDAARSAFDIVLTEPAHPRMKNYTVSGPIHSMTCLLALCLWAILVINPVSALTNPQEFQVLQDLYRSLNLNIEGDPCKEAWKGIGCSGSTVTSIELPGQELNGTLGGNLLDLQNLKKLDLSDNNIKGEIPLSLPPNATEVNLALNKFNQSIPLLLNPMKYLENLNISHNSLSCPLGNFFTGFPSLRQLDLSYNSFTGKLPISISASTNLTSVFLQRNKFEGSVDPLKNLPLSNLWIQFNKFNGVIPFSFFNISNLRIEKNYFTDDVPIIVGEINSPSVPAPSVEGKNNTTPPPPPPQIVITKKETRNYYIVGSVLLILLIIVGGLFLWYRKKPTTIGSSLELGKYRRIKCH
ncbi:hypothetical protein MKX03_006805, partial [Papaver bracteatum]